VSIVYVGSDEVTIGWHLCKDKLITLDELSRRIILLQSTQVVGAKSKQTVTIRNGELQKKKDMIMVGGKVS
jgi:hypothetical protein